MEGDGVSAGEGAKLGSGGRGARFGCGGLGGDGGPGALGGCGGAPSDILPGADMAKERIMNLHKKEKGDILILYVAIISL